MRDSSEGSGDELVDDSRGSDGWQRSVHGLTLGHIREDEIDRIFGSRGGDVELFGRTHHSGGEQKAVFNFYSGIKYQ